jgi:hypothetical protein
MKEMKKKCNGEKSKIKKNDSVFDVSVEKREHVLLSASQVWSSMYSSFIRRKTSAGNESEIDRS